MIERAAFERLYLNLERPLFNIALRWTWNEGEAQELVQEAFIRVWRKRQALSHDAIRPYLYKTVLNLGQNHARKRDRWTKVRSLLNFSATHQHDAQHTHLEFSELKHAINALPPVYKQILLLCEFSDLKQKEIADLLNLERSTVASRRNQAIKLLKQEFNHD